MKYFFLMGLVLLTLVSRAQKQKVRIVTTEGTLVVALSDLTPRHRDNFLKLAKQRYFDSLLFHRVIQGFMIQAGDPNSRRAQSGDRLGMGGPGYRVPAEFNTRLFHRKGVIAAARDNNPEKASSGSQFYLVQGKTYTEKGLDSLEKARMQGRRIPDVYRSVYKTVGGTPWLDQNYTVFGQVIRGEEVIDRIAAVKTDKNDRPLRDVRILKIRRQKKFGLF